MPSSQGPRFVHTIHVVLIACALALQGCTNPPHEGRKSPAIRKTVKEAHLFEADLVERAQRDPQTLTNEDVIAIGYLEQQRLGFGSPFRLAEQAMSDSRLSEDMREKTAWAVLVRTMEGKGYQVHPRSLDRIGVLGGGTSLGSGEGHLRVIERAIRESKDAWTGERAVRMAYAIAEAEGSVAQKGAVQAAYVAALVKDRRQAQEDVSRLLDKAHKSKKDPLDLLKEWRATYQFSAEAPSLRGTEKSDEAEAIRQALKIAKEVRLVGPLMQNQAVRTYHRSQVPSLLSREAAARLSTIADSTNAPPNSAIRNVMTGTDKLVRTIGEVSRIHEMAVERFLQKSITSEHLTAELVLLDRWSRSEDGILPLVQLSVAVGLRAFKQEPVIVAKAPFSVIREVEQRNGFRQISFSSGTPESWQAHYAILLDQAIRDIKLVLPGFSAQGLNVRFGESDYKEPYLALHNPNKRTIYLPPQRFAGTLMHELAHDLDWQMARRSLGKKGVYWSDDLVNKNRKHSMNGLMRSLVQSQSRNMGKPLSDRILTRPAEVFARNVDWLVTTGLAGQGRSNGYLSAYQDEVLLGYGSVTIYDAEGQQGTAVIRLLEAITSLEPKAKAKLQASVGTKRRNTPEDLVRILIKSDVEGDRRRRQLNPDDALRILADTRERITGLARKRDLLIEAEEASICEAVPLTLGQLGPAVRKDLIREVAQAKIRGLLLESAYQMAGGNGYYWMAQRLYGPPLRTAPVSVEVEVALKELLGTLGEERGFEEEGDALVKALHSPLQAKCKEPVGKLF